MSIIEKKLKDRSGSKCEISGLEHDLIVYTLAPHTNESLEHSVLITKILAEQIDNPETTNVEGPQDTIPRLNESTCSRLEHRIGPQMCSISTISDNEENFRDSRGNQ